MCALSIKLANDLLTFDPTQEQQFSRNNGIKTPCQVAANTHS